MGVIAYVLPFLFVLQPSLIRSVAAWEIVLATVTAAVGVLLLGMALIGNAFRPIGPQRRLLLFLAATALLLPHSVMGNNTVGWIAEGAGAALAGLVRSSEWRRLHLARRTVGPSAAGQRN